MAALTTVGVFIVIGAFVALVVAGINVADTLPAAGDVARDTGVFRAITAWATPLGLLGVATRFGVAIPASLARVRAGLVNGVTQSSSRSRASFHHACAGARRDDRLRAHHRIRVCADGTPAKSAQRRATGADVAAPATHGR